MIGRYPKYSIIIPCHNGAAYLPNCIDTIVGQRYDNYELILSDDHSTDGTDAYLKALEHPKVKVIYCPERLSMTEHWEFALSHACGEWLMFVGQDDGLQPYFFVLADRLTEIAQKKNLRTIMSERAYFFWQGCEHVYGDIAVAYHARNARTVRNCRLEGLKALLGLRQYFDLPEMYTTSLFHRDIIAEAKLRQGGRLLVTHPQDANLAAIACSLEKKYLMSFIPLGWVGSSPKSAGMAITCDATKHKMEKGELELKNEYLNKIEKSKLEYSNLAGDFEFANLSIYFWQSCLKTQNLRSSFINKILYRKIFKIVFFCQVLNEVKKSDKSSVRLSMFNEIVRRNGCDIVLIRFGSLITFSITAIFLWLSGLSKRLQVKFLNHVNYVATWSNDVGMSMLKASNIVDKLVTARGWLKFTS